MGGSRRSPWVWLASASALAVAGGLLFVWSRPGPSPRERWLASAALLLLPGGILYLRLLAHPRAGWKGRVSLLLAALATLLIARRSGLRPLVWELLGPVRWSLFSRGVPVALEGASSTPAGTDGPALALHRNWPGFLGPDRDSRLEITLARDWTERPPRERWRIALGPAWSGFAVAGGLAFTQEQRGSEECLVCYELASGEERWAHGSTARFDSDLGGVGPRATPLCAEGRVHALGALGRISTYVQETGELLWSRELAASAELPEWGLAGSPVLFDGLLIVAIGGPDPGSLLALRPESGELVWSAGGERVSYSSPRPMRLAGREWILLLGHESLAGHDPRDGQVLWRHAWGRGMPHVADPLALDGDSLVVSTGYGVGAARLRLEPDDEGGFEAREVWRSLALKAVISNFVLREASLYGLDDGILCCVDAKSGRRRWKGGRYGHGQVLLAGDLLLVSTQAGELALVEADPREHREKAFVPVLDGNCMNAPALAAPFLLLRNDREAVCIELPLAAGELRER